MAGKIFLNYRRGDDPGFVQALYLRLEEELGRDALFMDVEGHIKGGDDFVAVLRAQVAECDILLAVIGPRWLEAADERGRRRLDNPDDWVRVEIVGALEAGKRVIPVLVGGADIPRAEDLPEPVKPLARRQAIRITLERFRADSEGLVNQVKAALGELEAARAAATLAERRAAEEAEARRQAEEAERVARRERQEAERARQQGQAGMMPEAIREVLEVDNWAFVKDKNDPAELRDHIARFAGGPTERFAAERLAGLVWAGLGSSPGKPAVQSFLDEFPTAREADAARQLLATLEAEEKAVRETQELRRRETQAWGAIAARTDMESIEGFIRDWPDGAHAGDARARLEELRRASGLSRRGLLKGVGYGVGGAVAVGGLGVATLVPGMPGWRLLNDRSTRTLTGHTDVVTSVAFSPDGRAVVSGSEDGTARLWDGVQGAEMGRFGYGEYPIGCVAFAPDGRSVATGDERGTVTIWEIDSGNSLVTSRTLGKMVASVAFTPDGRSFLAAGWDETFKLFDAGSGKEMRRFSGHSNWVRSVAVSPDGRTVVSGSMDATVKVWELASGKLLGSHTGHTGEVRSVVVAPGGKSIVSGSEDGTIRIWQMFSPFPWKTLQRYDRRGKVNAVAVLPSGLGVLAGDDQQEISLWSIDAATISRVYSGHIASVTSVAIASGGSRAASGSVDGTVKLWDLNG